ALQVNAGSLSFDAIAVDGNATIDVRGSQLLGDVDVGGQLAVTTGAGGSGGVSQRNGSVLRVAGNASFTADTTAQQDAALANAGNDFGGTLAFRAANGGSWRDLAVRDTVGALALADVAAAGQVNLQAQGATSFGGALSAGTLALTTNGPVTQTAPLTVAGATSLDAGSGSVALANAANDFGGALTLSAASATIVDGSGGLQLANVATTGALDLRSDRGTITQAANTTVAAGGASSFVASQSGAGSAPADIVLANAGNQLGGTVNLDGAAVNIAASQLAIGVLQASGAAQLAASGNVSIAQGQTGNLSVNTQGGNLALGNLTVAGDFTAQTRVAANDPNNLAAGNITQLNNGQLNVIGDTDLSAGSASIQLANPGNYFGGTLALDAGSTTVASAGNLTLGTVLNRGNLTLASQGFLSLADATTVQGNLTLVSNGALDLGRAAIDGNLSLDSNGGAVTLGAGGATSVAGALAIASDGGHVSLGQTSVQGTLAVTTAGGNLSQTAALNVVGASTVSAGSGTVTLDAQQNVFGGALALAGGRVEVAAAAALTLGEVRTTGDLKLTTSGGPIAQAPGVVLVAAGKTTLDARSGGAAAAITLANDSNDFQGVLEARGAAMKLRDSVGSLKLGNLNASGMVDAAARGGPIMLEPGTLQLAMGGMILTPDPRPSAIDMPKVRVESLSTAKVEAVPSSTSSASSGSSAPVRGAVLLQATEQTGSSTSVIKVAAAPVSNSGTNLIAVGKVIALDATAANGSVIRSASFEVVDGMSSGATLEVPTGDGVKAVIDSAGGKITLDGGSGLGDYDKAIQGIKLRTGGDLPANTVLKIRVTLTDDAGRTESKTVTLQVNAPPPQVSRR
ncbi:MAG: hypothetical protein NBV65_10155, partial [Burkholderiaceae bacterium]|nr:hypothetical protein [Burkholderiaceae bacterium]